MTPQDTQLLQDFLNQLTHTQVATKDREAQTLIAGAFAQQPDAAYLVVQRALILEQALREAHNQLADLQQEGSNRGCRRRLPISRTRESVRPWRRIFGRQRAS